MLRFPIQLFYLRFLLAFLLAFGCDLGCCNVRAQERAEQEVSEASPPGQIADGRFQARVENPRHAVGTGPLVLVDEAHSNFHTIDGRYGPFAQVLRADGFRVQANQFEFSLDALRDAKLLVVANALAESNVRNWSLPTPSAFSDLEIEQLHAWVQGGGALLLIADHMPFPGSVDRLGRRFGVSFRNGFVFRNEDRSPIRFDRQNGQLQEHPITQGSRGAARIEWVMSFTGSCFKASEKFEPLMVLGADSVSLEPQTAWDFKSDTPRQSVQGYLQGAVCEYGAGRLAVFGEAAMFTAQRSAGKKGFGLNAKEAEYNQPFLLNTIHWLTERR